MSDVLTPEKRSKNMAAIRSRDTGPEVFIRKCLFALGYRYRKNDPRFPGRPDIYLPKYKTAMFVHGCYWHRHEDCKYAYVPKSRVEFWTKKFQANIERDRMVRERLLACGIKTLIIWECTVREMKSSEAMKADIIESIVRFLESEEMYLEL